MVFKSFHFSRKTLWIIAYIFHAHAVVKLLKNPSHKRRMRWGKKMNRKKKKREQIYLLLVKRVKRSSSVTLNRPSFHFSSLSRRKITTFRRRCRRRPVHARAQTHALSIPHLVFSFLSHFLRWTRTRKTEKKNDQKRKKKEQKKKENETKSKRLTSMFTFNNPVLIRSIYAFSRTPRELQDVLT